MADRPACQVGRPEPDLEVDSVVMRSPTARIASSPRLAGWIALVCWCALIFILSAQPHLTVVDHDLADLVLRKLGHVTVFGVLALLASMTLRQEGAPPGLARIGALGFAIAYAAGDEWHQTFVAGRSGHPRDVAIDAVGAALALGLAHRRAARATVVPDAAAGVR